MGKRIIVGSRGSKLATIQAEGVLAKLQGLNPELEFSLATIVTRGDRERKVPLERMAGVGVFVKELEEALLERKIDLAVHSLKDMPTETPEGFRLAVVTERVDPRDVLVSSLGRLAELPPGARIGTGSPRRAVQLLAQRPDVETRPLRGNIDTRLRKAASAELDGVLLAAAALIRLGMESMITEYLPTDIFVPAVGQGALGIEIRADDAQMGELVAPLNHEPSWLRVTAERAFLKSLGGGCRAPIAALGTLRNNTLHLRGMVADPVRGDILRAEMEGSAMAAEGAGYRLAKQMMELGAASLIERVGV